MTDKLYVSPSPHLRQGDTTRKLMGDVIIALIPAVLASGIIFGYQSLIVMAGFVAFFGGGGKNFPQGKRGGDTGHRIQRPGTRGFCSF